MDMKMRLLCSVIILSLITGAYLDEQNHIYEEGEEVILWMNTVGPFHNNQERYAYFSLPFCVGPNDFINHYHETLSEALLGVKLVFSGIDIEFKMNNSKEDYCSVQLNERYKPFEYAVKNHYWYQMYIDDLPIWGVVGTIADNKYYIWTHKKFQIGYNGKQIVDVNLTTERKVELTPETQLTFTYEVIWTRSDVKFKDRFDKYLEYDFFKHNVHSYGIFSSFIIVILLIGVVSMILWRMLRKDYAALYCKDQDLDKMKPDIIDEYGWKQVHGDVFRSTSHSLYFSALIGSGYQLTIIAFIDICFAALGGLYANFFNRRGSLLFISILIYTTTSPINGYFGGSLYARMGGKMWIQQMIASAFLLPTFACSYPFYINLIAVYYESSRVISFGTMVEVACIFIFVILPLTLVGAALGRELAGQPDYPCHINTVPRPIPEKKWFLKPGIIYLLGGVLPFASIFSEIYFVFTSFWTYKIYYDFMLLVVINLIIVTICITIVCTYFLLNAEDYRWHWTSFLIAASTSTYVYIYAIYYFITKTNMYGLLQTTLYFGYMTLFCGALGVICGTVGYVGASIFVNKIYSSIKIAMVEENDDTDCPKICKLLDKDSDENTKINGFGTDGFGQKNDPRRDLQNEFSNNSVECLTEAQIREKNVENNTLGSVKSN